MRNYLVKVVAVPVIWLMAQHPALALTGEQLLAICKSGKTECHDNPMLSAYVGGALDLLATLNDDTDYLSEVYCKDAKALFNVPDIIDYMLAHHEAYRDRNAMNLFVRYFEEKGGCKK